MIQRLELDLLVISETLLFLRRYLRHFKLFIARVFLLFVHLTIHSFLHLFEFSSAISCSLTSPTLFDQMLIKTMLGSFPFVLNTFSFAKSVSSFGTLREIVLLIGDFWVALLVETALCSMSTRNLTSEIKLLHLILRSIILLSFMRWPSRESSINFLVFGVKSDLRNSWVSISFRFSRIMTLSSCNTLSLNEISTLGNVEASRTCWSFERWPILLNGIPNDIWFNSWERSLLYSFICRYNMRRLKILLLRFWIRPFVRMPIRTLHRELIRRRNGRELNSWCLLKRSFQALG